MMLFKKLQKSEIKKILVITLSNIGDVVLTFPVIDVLKREFPSAQLSVVVGPKGECFFRENPNISQLFVFDKHQEISKTISLVFQLRNERFDLVVDLRNTAIPFLIAAKYRTSPRQPSLNQKHRRIKHLERLKTVVNFDSDEAPQKTLTIGEADQKYVNEIIAQDIGERQNYVVVCPGAADEKKRWPAERFTETCDRLVERYQVKIVFVGDEQDRSVVRTIIKKMDHSAVDLSGRTTLTQLAHLLQNSQLTIVNDSAPMHLASYLGVPVLALFGPTNPVHYGPWSRRACLVKGNHIYTSKNKNEINEEPAGMDEISSDVVLDAITLNPEGFNFNS